MAAEEIQKTHESTFEKIRKTNQHGQKTENHFEDVLEMVPIGSNQTHYEVGKRVRKTIEEIGGTMPENLPGVASIKFVGRKKEKKVRSLP